MMMSESINPSEKSIPVSKLHLLHDTVGCSFHLAFELYNIEDGNLDQVELYRSPSRTKHEAS